MSGSGRARGQVDQLNGFETRGVGEVVSYPERGQ